MKHPSQETLALQAGGDLGWLERWKTARHLSGCSACRDEVAAFSEVREILPELNEMPEVPWNRLAAEMRANIRLGLAAGECVRFSDPPLRESPLFHGARALVAFASVCAMLATAVVLERPTPVHASEPVVQATDNGIQRRFGDRAFGLMHPGAQAQDVTYTVGAQGTMGARYVDSETGAMTMTKVYVE
jgi:hypothetical protein